ncbi:CheW domain-containing protein [Ectopseudomonas hydrolytica]|uniref:CheW domain-containing protein n=1 Tax=Ectopseudomonas hydrolytica TaxID=2493633 RepID=UPI0002787878|nr:MULTISPECIES: CheW domain-containing protein [Pseudomonas]ATH81751.1 chemotaxis protein CheW [Pseudomonas mendocina]EJO94085.1 putative CheW protein [Pseudomonas mendocina DLHK]MBA4243202.1 chemotaxis protein CheW [Pseudomonas sp.]MBF8164462.1 chemotaxis protein CheW [Pseudomonas mendocina]UTH33407.1 chemotaxis protein CheW [Pseudomonas hydrolytica]
MSRNLATATRSQLALQSYLDGLLQEAAAELEMSVSLDEFEAAVLEEQVRDARLVEPVAVAPVIEPQVQAPPVEIPVPVQTVVVEEAPPPVAPVVELAPSPAAVLQDGRPGWAEEPFECLLFDVAGLTLAVPLICLGSIYPLQDQELTPLFGQPEWFLGILPSQAGNLKVLDTARWVMPDRYREDFRDGLQYVISVQGYEWGLAVHQVSRSIRLDPSEVKWRSQRTQRPWLAGTVIEHMCALLDVAALAELIASGGAKRLAAGKLH